MCANNSLYFEILFFFREKDEEVTKSLWHKLYIICRFQQESKENTGAPNNKKLTAHSYWFKIDVTWQIKVGLSSNKYQ